MREQRARAAGMPHATAALLLLLQLVVAATAREHMRDLEVSEGVSTGTRIGFIGDGTSGNSGPPYLIVTVPGSGVDSDLAVDESTGEIRTKVPLDRETRASYSLVAIPRSGENVRVLVRVLDENDNAPTFPISVMHIEFPENTPRDVKRTLYPARDLDLGVFNTQRYNVVSGNVNNNFRLSSHRERDGVLYLDLQINGFLDRETTPSYSLVIEALDGGSPPMRGSMTVNITIQDVNDNQPIFNQSRYFATVPENATVGTSVLQVFATDLDAGENGLVEYMINRRQSDKEKMFRIEPSSGVVVVNRPLDFETKEVHELVIVARDHGVQPLETTTFVSIRVTDVNDNQPTINVIFLSDDATPKISESAMPGEFVARVSVNDPDSKTDYSNSNVTVTLQGGEGHFGLESRDNFIYVVIVSLPIDRELRSNYTLSVIATDKGTPPLHASRTFYLRVTDVNDNRPEFEKAIYYANVLEVADPGSSVLQVAARDSDEGVNSALTYSLVETSDSHTQWFTIDAHTGLITTRAHVDCETDPVPKLTVLATDGGSPPLSSSTTVFVTIHDVNDNEPIFDQTFYNVSVPENDNVGHCILKVSATDPDCGVNAMVNYTIGEGQLRIKEFEINSGTGAICVVGQLDYELRDTYEFPVVATDRGGLSTTAIVKIQLTDVNDNRPVFYPREYNVSLSEGGGGSHSTTQPVVVVVATDRDSGKFGSIVYRIVAGNDASLFRIDRKTGEVFLTRANLLSTRAQPYHKLNVTATDGAGLKSLQDAEVLISVTDSSRRPPTFERPRYTFTVREDVNSNALVGTVKASSHAPTSSESVRYAIYSGDPDGYFVIDSDMGAIRTARQLDHEVHETVLLNVQAMSGDPPTYSHAQVNIIIDDMNDNAPVFDSSTVRISVPENVEPGSPLYEAHARDRDSGENSIVRYHLVDVSSPGLFAIDSRLGHLTLLRNLDYESAQKHTLVIQASDTGMPSLSSNLTVLVEVQDVNDNTPQFERPEYTVSVLESIAPNSQIVQVTAVDHDTGNNARLTYRLKQHDNHTDMFGIFPNSGLIYLKRGLDREQQDKYVLTVTVSDNGTPAGSASTRVSISVLDTNDNNPAFDATSYEFSIEENLPAGAFVGRIRATDPDLDHNAVVRYSFIPGNFSFRINPTTGEISTRKPVDREARSSYELVAEARDQGVPPRSTWIAVRIGVADVNDNAPELVDPREDVISVREQQPVGTQVTRLRALDRDFGANASITYSILKGRDSDGYGVFSVDAQTGSIRTKAVLDHEERSIYRLAVAATDGGSPPRQTVRPLRVEVLDLGDHRPTFTSSSLLFKVKENAGVGFMVGVVAMTSDNEVRGRSGGGVRYSLTSATPRNPYGPSVTDDGLASFEIDKSTGSLVVSRRLDREKQPEYRLEVRTLDTLASNNPQSSAVTVRVEVEDINDNAPKWTSSSITIELMEDVPVSSVVSNVSATDDDFGPNADLRYSLVKTFPESSTFAVDALTGIITLNSPLDYEEVKEYLVVVSATDQAVNVSERLSTSVTFIVRVLDTNDNAPVFLTPTSGTLTLDDPVTAGLVIGKIIAVDNDTADNGRVRYSVDDSRFKINPDTGVLSVANDMSMLKKGFVSVNVTASDQGSPSLRTVFPVRVVVRGSTENPPKFLKPSYTVTIAEDVVPGTFVIRMEAVSSGNEPGLASNVTYHIPPGAADGSFAIDPVRGTVTTRALLDRERRPRYTVPVFVSEGRGQRPSDMALLHVLVQDVNDHSPAFAPGACYPLRVPENADLAVIHTFTAEDPDEGPSGEITYSISGGNIGNKFSIDLRSGMLSARPLDREAHAKYTLIITAQDRGSPPLQGSCNTTVMVEDANDNDPMFSQPLYTAQVAEDVPLDTVVIGVQATDADVGVNSRITYTLANQTHWLFKIDNRTGIISTSGYFDREKRSVYELLVVATDGGRYDARLQRVPVRITVTDVNDNKPVFASYPFTAQVPAYTPAGTNIVTVLATDADLGTNSEIVYSFINEPSKFKINPTTGVITASASLAADSGRLFHLEVLARDRGNPPQSATGLVEVRVGDAGDAPSLRCQNATYLVRLPENSAVDTEVVQLSAVRTDGRRQHIRYSLAASTYDSAFSVNSDSGLMRVRDSNLLDFETVREISLSVMAQVDGPMYGYCQVRVRLDDENDNAPRFTQYQYSASVWEGNNKGTFVMQVSATDVDDGPNGHILYHIVDGNHDNAFVMEPPFSGLIKTNIVLDREIRDTYRLTIIATDEGTPQHTGTATLRINIVDANDNLPTFPPHSVITVNEGVELGTVLTTVAANDVDTNPALTYSFSDGSTSTPEFSIDRFSGKITLSSRLDAETRNEYSVAISASDAAHTANTTLTIRVTDVNDNAPVFGQPSYQAVIPDGLTSVVLTVNATDEDSGKNAAIVYSLVTAHSGISIDPTTGAVFVNRSALLVSDSTKVIELTVAAQDMGVPPLRDTAPLTLHVNDDDNKASFFTQEEYQIRIREDSARGTVLLKLATPSVEPAVMDFSIVTGDDDATFEILSPNGEIILLRELDREERNAYTLRVIAGSNNATVFVTVDDANDNAPVFQGVDTSGGYSARVSETSAIGSAVLTVAATDADLPGGPNSDLWFEILGGNDLDLFLIEARVGVIRTKKPLDADTGNTEHTLVVRASDRALSPDRSLSTVVLVRITILDENDNSPQFPVKEYLESVAENEPVGTSVLTARAVDLDSGVYGRVNYSLLADSEDCWKLFRVDTETGVVSTNMQFDYESRDGCSFMLRAVDFGGRNAQVRVRVEIESRDEYHPQFSERTYRFTIPPPTRGGSLPVGYVIGNVQATDKDRGADGRIVYIVTTQQTYFKVNRTTGAIMVKKKLEDAGLDVSFIVTASSGMQGSLTNTTVVEVVVDPLAEPGSNLASSQPGVASSSGLADWALGLLIALILIVLIFGGVFLFLHMRNRRHKKVNKPALSTGSVGGNDGFVDASGFDTIPIRGGTSSQFAPPKYDEIPPYRNASSSGAATTSELSGSEQSGSSGRGSAEDGEDVEDEEIRMINEGPLQRDGLHRPPDDDNISDVSIHNTQEYLARLGIVDNTAMAPTIEQMQIFDEEGAAEADLTNLIYAKLKVVGTGSERGGSDDGNLSSTVDHVILGGYDAPVGGVGTHQPSMTGSLSSIVHSEEELTGSYNWDYLLDWGPQYQPLAHVFSEIARLKDDTASVQSGNSGSSSSKGKTVCKAVPPPLLTSVAPRSIAAPATAPAPRNIRSSLHAALPRSPIGLDPAGFSTSAAMSPSFSPSLSPLATRSPSISPLVSPGHIPRPSQRTTVTETELRI